MALAAATVWEIRTTGDDLNGGAFVSGASGTDWSQQDAAQYAVTDAVTNGTTTITSATANFGTDVVGNILYIAGGTGGITANRYQITARTDNQTITVDRSIGLTAGTGATLNIGGAIKSPGILNSTAPTSVATGHTIWIKAGTYSITDASNAVVNGRLQLAVRVKIEGYQTTRGDLGTAPLLQVSGVSGFNIVTLTSADGSVCVNIGVDGDAQVSMTGFSSVSALLFKCYALDCVTGFALDVDATAINCLATGCTTVGFSGVGAYNGCVAHTNANVGFSLNTSAVAVNCLSYGNTGGSSHGFSLAADGAACFNCVAYGNGGNGFQIAADANTVLNCIAEANTGAGFNGSGNTGTSRLYCATYNNTGGATGGTIVFSVGNVTGSGSFFTNAAGADFSLNTTSGAGAAARAAGFPGALQAGGTGYLDIGALQHQDPAGGGISILGSTFGSPHIPVSYR